jgi:molybdate/tungstate transport system ATP-binding protein
MSALDPVFRQGVQRMIHELHKELDLTFLMVSHNFDEVLNLADEAAVIRNGALEQTGGVREIFERPGNVFVADFVGMKNVLPVSSNGRSVLCDGLEIRPCRGKADAEYAAFRPEEVILRLPGESGPGTNAFEGVVTGVFPRGFSLEVQVDVQGRSVLAVVTRRRADKLGLEPGLEVVAVAPEEAVHLF